MKVRCISNTGKALPSHVYDPGVNLTEATEFPITRGRVYFVYGVTVYRYIAWYYVFDDYRLRWPTWMPAPLFDIVDGTIPRSWIMGYFRFSREEQHPLLSFPEWAKDHFFYERLVDDDEEAVRIFALRRAEVEREET